MTSSNRSGDNPLFDTPISRVLDAAPPDIATTLRRLIDEPLREVTSLREEVRSYVERLRGLNEKYEFLDLALARRVAAQCEALLDGFVPDSSNDVLKLIQAAVLYFFEGEDAEDDAQSPIGFDDDSEVVALIAREIGREEVLEIQPPEDS